MPKCHKPSLFIFLAILSSNAFTQDINKAIISGRVVNFNTGQPISYVNVFLSNTTKGSTTNDKGYFTIRGIPAFSSYELVVSMMGFEVQTKQIQLTEPETITINFRLRPTVIPMKEVVIEALDANEWRRNLEIFKREILGNTINAFECKILNPEVLDFKINPKPYYLTANASRPMEIINNALGYRIHVILLSFKFEQDLSQYETKLQFEELKSENIGQRKIWTNNRKKAYNGSLRHFLTSLITLRTKEDGFSIYKSQMLESKFQDFKLDKKAQVRLLRSGNNAFERKLLFEDYLKVVFKNEKDEIHKRDYQTSFIKLRKDYVTITTSGQIYEILNVINYGRWGEDRLAEELPLDYIPKQN